MRAKTVGVGALPAVGPTLARTVLLCVLLAVTAPGCSDDSENDAGAAGTPAATPSAATIDYVAEVNALCAELMPKVMEVVGGGHPTTYPIEDFTSEQPKINALIAEFDTKVEALPVADAHRSAADALTAFRNLSDAADEKLAAAAATGDQASFDAAFDDRLRTVRSSSVPTELAAAGITCNAR